MNARVRATPLGTAAVQVRDVTFPPGESRWVEVGWDYEQGGLQIRTYSDDEACDWPEYGRP